MGGAPRGIICVGARRVWGILGHLPNPRGYHQKVSVLGRPRAPRPSFEGFRAGVGARGEVFGAEGQGLRGQLVGTWIFLTLNLLITGTVYRNRSLAGLPRLYEFILMIYRLSASAFKYGTR
jgi:hypothetical protein